MMSYTVSVMRNGYEESELPDPKERFIEVVASDAREANKKAAAKAGKGWFAAGITRAGTLSPSERSRSSGRARGPGGRFAKKSSSRTVRRGTMGPRLPGGGFYSTGKKDYCSKCGGPHKFKHGRA